MPLPKKRPVKVGDLSAFRFGHKLRPEIPEIRWVRTAQMPSVTLAASFQTHCRILRHCMALHGIAWHCMAWHGIKVGVWMSHAAMHHFSLRPPKRTSSTPSDKGMCVVSNPATGNIRKHQETSGNIRKHQETSGNTIQVWCALQRLLWVWSSIFPIFFYVHVMCHVFMWSYAWNPRLSQCCCRAAQNWAQREARETSAVGLSNTALNFLQEFWVLKRAGVDASTPK